MSEPARRLPRLQQSRLVFTLATTSAAPASKKTLADTTSQSSHGSPPTSAQGSSSAALFVVVKEKPVNASLRIAPNVSKREWFWVHLKLNISVHTVEKPREEKPPEPEIKLTMKRTTYTDEQKYAVVQQTLGMTPNDARKRVCKEMGYEKVTAAQIEAWRKLNLVGPEGEHKKRKRKRGGGRRVDLEYEQAVIDQLIFTTLETVDNKEKAVVQANVMYSNDLVVRAARKVHVLHDGCGGALEGSAATFGWWMTGF